MALKGREPIGIPFTSPYLHIDIQLIFVCKIVCVPFFIVVVVVVVALGDQGRACDRGNGNRQDERIPSRAALGSWRVRAAKL